jgi:DNA-binding IclR family transcriptional regulator
VTRDRRGALLAHGHRTVDRVAAILEAAAAGPQGSVRLSTLAETLGAPKSSLHGLVQGLLAVGYLVERQGAYSLGPGIHTLLGHAQRPTLGELAQGPMEDLAAQFDETVMLGHRVGDSIVYLAAVESRQLIRYSPALGQRRPVLPTSMGKIYVAELPDEDLQSYLTTRVDNRRRRKALAMELDEIRQTGVAINRNETLPGLCGVAAGVRERGELVACLSVVGPSDRLVPNLKRVTKAVRAAANQVRAQLP